MYDQLVSVFGVEFFNWVFGNAPDTIRRITIMLSALGLIAALGAQFLGIPGDAQKRRRFMIVLGCMFAPCALAIAWGRSIPNANWELTLTACCLAYLIMLRFAVFRSRR